MKVIQVAGLSGSGKTTFIRALLPLLAGSGRAGVIKHIGHHAMDLPEGKDTTVFLEAGAGIVAGIDLEKTVIAVKETSLADALDILSARGAACAVVEGYKTGRLPKIAIGELEAENCILRNPEPGQVVRALDRFPDYYTIGELVHSIGGDRTTTCTATIPIPGQGPGRLDVLEKVLADVEKSAPDLLPGVSGVRIAVQRGSLFGKADELLVAVTGETGEVTAGGLASVVTLCRDTAETLGILFL